MNRQTDRLTENMTFPQSTYAGGNNFLSIAISLLIIKCYNQQSAHFVVEPIRIDVTKVWLGNWLSLCDELSVEDEAEQIIKFVPFAAEHVDEDLM